MAIVATTTSTILTEIELDFISDTLAEITADVLANPSTYMGKYFATKENLGVAYYVNELGTIVANANRIADDKSAPLKRLPERKNISLIRNGTASGNTWLAINYWGVNSHQAKLKLANNADGGTSSYYLSRLEFSHRNVGDVSYIPELLVKEQPLTDTGNIANGDTTSWSVRGDSSTTQENLGNYKYWSWHAPDFTYVIDSTKNYAFRLTGDGTISINDLRVELYFEEIIS